MNAGPQDVAYQIIPGFIPGFGIVTHALSAPARRCCACAGLRQFLGANRIVTTGLPVVTMRRKRDWRGFPADFSSDGIAGASVSGVTASDDAQEARKVTPLRPIYKVPPLCGGTVGTVCSAVPHWCVGDDETAAYARCKLAGVVRALAGSPTRANLGTGRKSCHCVNDQCERRAATMLW